MLAILPALALVQPYNLRGEDINVTIGPQALRRVRLVIEAECAAEYAWIAAGNPPGGRDARNSGEPLAAADERIRVALRDITNHV